MSDGGPWQDPAQAEVYGAFCERWPLYGEVSAALVRFADVAAARRVADLGCGTGVTSRALLAALPPEAVLVGVDPAERMVRAATEALSDPRARFVLGDARLLPGTSGKPGGAFDRVVSNMAIWLDEDLAGAFAAIRAALAGGGSFAFSVPAEYVGHAAHLTTGVALEVGLALGEAIVRHAARPEGQGPPPGQGFDPWRLLLDAGFEAVDARLFRRTWTVAEYLAWLAQPVVAGGLLPALDDAGKAGFFADLSGRLQADGRFEGRFLLVRAS